MSDASKAVFLSYASQDSEAAKRISEALRSTGIEVWFSRCARGSEFGVQGSELKTEGVRTSLRAFVVDSGGRRFERRGHRGRRARHLPISHVRDLGVLCVPHSGVPA